MPALRGTCKASALVPSDLVVIAPGRVGLLQKANGLCTPIGLVALALGKALAANGLCTPIGFVALALGKALASFPSGTTVLDRLEHHEVLT